MNSELQYFATHFILKEKMDRIIYLIKHNKFGDELHKLERSLNKKCTLIDKNAYDIYSETLVNLKINRGFYYDDFEAIYLDTSDLVPKGDSLFICQEKNIAFVFHHEGWIYFCNE